MVNLDVRVCVLSYEFCTTKYGWMLIKGHSSCCCWFHWDFTWTMKLVLHSGLEGSAIGAACIESLCIETGVLDFCWKLHFFFFTVGCSCPCDTSSQCMQAQLPRVMEPYIPVWQSTSGGSSPLLGGGKLLYFSSCGNFMLSRRFLCCRCCELLMTSW